MKFALVNCPVCGKALTKVKEKRLYCPTDVNRDNPEAITTTHKYEVWWINKYNCMQKVDVPPFAIDSEYIIRDGVERYRSTLYIQNKEEDNVPWKEIGDLPYIEPAAAPELIERIKKLLPFI